MGLAPSPVDSQIAQLRVRCLPARALHNNERQTGVEERLLFKKDGSMGQLMALVAGIRDRGETIVLRQRLEDPAWLPGELTTFV